VCVRVVSVCVVLCESTIVRRIDGSSCKLLYIDNSEYMCSFTRKQVIEDWCKVQ
jgi:hypothetical protein